MPDISSTQTNFIQPIVFFYSHNTTFVEPSGSESFAGAINLTRSDASSLLSFASSMEILVTELERGYRARKPIPIKITKSNDSYMASFDEANIHASGETWAQAARHLKSLIVDIYDSLATETAQLSRPAKNQLDTLLRYVHAE